MKKKYTFTKLAFSNLKWGLVISVLLLLLWFISFFEEKKMILPVTENKVFEKTVIDSTYYYQLSDIKTVATLEINTPFLKKLFLARPIFNLDFITCLFIISLAFSIFKFVKSVEKGVDFKNKTYKLFYWISASCFVYCMARASTTSFANNYIQNLTNSKYLLKNSFETIFIIAFIGYFFFILGHSFKKGFILQQEQDLTV